MEPAGYASSAILEVLDAIANLRACCGTLTTSAGPGLRRAPYWKGSLGSMPILDMGSAERDVRFAQTDVLLVIARFDEENVRLCKT